MLNMIRIFNRKEKMWLAIFSILSVGSSFFEMMGIALILPIINMLNGDTNIYIEHILRFWGLSAINRNEQIVWVSIFLIGFYVFKNVYSPLILYYQYHFLKKKQLSIATDLLDFYLNKPYEFHILHNSSNLIRNISSSIPNVFSGVIMGAMQLITEVLVIIFIVSFLFIIDYKTCLMLLIIGMIFLCINIKFIKKILYNVGRESEKYLGVSIKWLSQSFFNIKTIKLLDKNVYFVNNFNKCFDLYTESILKYNYTIQIPRYMIEVFVVSGLLIIIIGKVGSSVDNKLIFESITAITLAAFRLMPSISKIVGLYNNIKYYMPLFETLYQDFIVMKEMPKKQELVPEIAFLNNILVDKISYKYEERNEYVLDNISFEIEKGQFIGITGNSGAGKTTLLDIIIGLIPTSVGKILVDNIDISLSIKSWQKYISYVPQSVTLIDGNIKENIILGEEFYEKKFIDTLKLADIYEDIEKLTDKSETNIGENGVMLSGGQRQRIGIARALYKNPEVLILDEATSALDNETEKKVMESILKMKGKITIIAVAHRLSTLEKCDKIINLK